MSRSIEDLQENEELCNYCEETDRGMMACVGTPNGPIFCEGVYCEQAYETYLEECEEEE